MAPVSSPLAVEGFLERHGRAIAVALVLVASIRIIATYTVFSHTYDEPAHIACGMEWLDKGVYQWEPQHPPLARVATALGPYLLGTRCSEHAQRGPRFDDPRGSRHPLLRPPLRSDAGAGAPGGSAVLLDRVPGGVWVGAALFQPVRGGGGRLSVQLSSAGPGPRRPGHNRYGAYGFPGSRVSFRVDLGGASHPGSRRAVRRKHRPGHAFEVFHAGVLSRRRGFGAGLVFRHRASQAGLAAQRRAGKGYRRSAWRCWWLAC